MLTHALQPQAALLGDLGGCYDAEEDCVRALAAALEDEACFSSAAAAGVRQRPSRHFSSHGLLTASLSKRTLMLSPVSCLRSGALPGPPGGCHSWEPPARPKSARRPAAAMAVQVRTPCKPGRAPQQAARGAGERPAAARGAGARGGRRVGSGHARCSHVRVPGRRGFPGAEGARLLALASLFVLSRLPGAVSSDLR